MFKASKCKAVSCMSRENFVSHVIAYHLMVICTGIFTSYTKAGLFHACPQHILLALTKADAAQLPVRDESMTIATSSLCFAVAVPYSTQVALLSNRVESKQKSTRQLQGCQTTRPHLTCVSDA